MKVALFGIHRLLSDALTVLERTGILPEVVIFPPLDSPYHELALQICERSNIKIIRPLSVKDEAFIGELRNCFIDRIIVTGYHQIFPKSLFELAAKGAINCHGGLLPEERGPIPWKWAVYDNKPFTGITIHRMTEKVDQGEIYFRKKIRLDDDETSESLFTKITTEISYALPGFFKDGSINFYRGGEKTESTSGYQGQIPAELCRFDLKQTAIELQQRVRAFSPRPGVFLERNQERILVKKVNILTEAKPASEWIFQCSDQYIEITDFEIAKHD